MSEEAPLEATLPPAGETGGTRKQYIYAVAGRNRGETLGTCERMDVATGEWEWCPKLNMQRGSHGAAALGGIVYAVAGGGMKSNLTHCEAFDGQGEWREVPPLGVARHALAVAQSDTCIYAVGGWADGKVCAGDCEKFDPDVGSWEACAKLITPRRLHGAAVLDGRLYVFGGASEDKFTIAEAECYSPTTDSWASISPLPAPCYAGAIAVGSFIYVFLWGRYFLRYCPSTDTYTKMGAMPLKEWYGFSLTAIGESIYVLGGVSDGQWKGWVYRYDTGDASWHELPRMLAVRRRSAAVACWHHA